MALTSTTLSGAITDSAISMVVASATGFVAKGICKIDSEYCEILSVDGTKIGIARGKWGSAALAHASGAAVVVAADAGLDFKAPPPPDRVKFYGAAGAITVQPGVHVIQGGSAFAMTLARPSVDEDGMELTITAGSAQAHTVTSTGGFNAGGTTSDVATFQGAIGETMRVVAVNGYWNVDPDATTAALA